MKIYTQEMIEYEQSDFDDVKENMDRATAICILETLPRGWFPYNMPCWKSNVTASDYDNYRIVCAIDYAINKLLEE